MEAEIVQVIDPGFQAADFKIQGEGNPSQGDPVAHLKMVEEPQEGSGVEVSNGKVVGNVIWIVPIHELIFREGKINQEGEEHREAQENPSPILFRGKNHWVLA